MEKSDLYKTKENEAKKAKKQFILNRDDWVGRYSRYFAGSILGALLCYGYESCVSPHLGRYDPFANRGAIEAILEDRNRDSIVDIVLLNQFGETRDVFYGTKEGFYFKEIKK